MPEPLSIVTAVTGFVGFISSVRNSISTILSDVDAVKTDAETLVPTAIRLKNITLQIQIWQQLWKVHDGMPSELFELFWGSQGSQEIFQLLAQLQAKSEALSHEFASGFKSKKEKDHAQSEPLEDRAATSYNEKEESAKLGELHKLHKQGNSLYRRIGRSVFSKPILERHLKDLEDWTKLLQNISENYFIIHANNSKESDWKDHVLDVSMRFILPQVADDYSNASATLRDTLEDTGACTVDLHLDHRTEPARRMEVFQEAAHKHCFQYDFSMKWDQSFGGARVDFCCRVAIEEPGSEILLKRRHENFVTIAEKLFERMGSRTSSSLRLQMSDNDPAFIVEKLDDDEVSSTREADVQCLRSFMAAQKTDYEKTLHGFFKKEERHRLAYELAEWALIFLKTKWFTNLCSCCVYRIEANDLRTTFRARVAKIEHKCTDTGAPGDVRQWCEEELTNQHILRLGVLLVEIALGFPVPDVSFNTRRREIEIDDGFNIEDPERTPILYRRDITKKVQNVMGEDFKDAVNYCLQQSTAPRDIGRVHLDEFHKHVVEPLFIHYEQLSIKGPVRQLARRASRRRKAASAIL